MGTDIVETTKLGSIIYRIVSIDDKYTIYESSSKKPLGELSENDFAAIASFDSIAAARDHIKSLAQD